MDLIAFGLTAEWQDLCSLPLATAAALSQLWELGFVDHRTIHRWQGGLYQGARHEYRLKRGVQP
jgi:hypothetical protein